MELKFDFLGWILEFGWIKCRCYKFCELRKFSVLFSYKTQFDPMLGNVKFWMPLQNRPKLNLKTFDITPDFWDCIDLCLTGLVLLFS